MGAGNHNLDLIHNELIKSVAHLVSEREADDSILSVEDCDEVDTGTIGDDGLSAALDELAF